MRIVHFSDLHFWHVTLNPVRLAGKRVLGMSNLILNRAWKYRMEEMSPLVRRVRGMQPDHVLITGDLTTTSLEEEFEAVRTELSRLGCDPQSLTVIPGNHDRYTRSAVRRRLFESYFGQFAPSETYPWLKHIGEGTAILGLDTSRPTLLSARGAVQTEQLASAQRLLGESNSHVGRLLVACHYPVAIPHGVKEDRGHGLQGREDLHAFLSRLGPHLFCHGHIHAGWAFTPGTLPQALCLNPGAALKRRRSSGVHAGLLEILLDGTQVEVRRHVLRRGAWEVESLARRPQFFPKENVHAD